MTTMTPDQEVELRQRLGRNNAAFSTPYLDAIWTSTGTMAAAMVRCFEDLMNDTALFNDYTKNDTQEKRSQIFDHIAGKVLPYWVKKAAEETAAANPRSQGVKILGLRAVPPRRVEYPATDPGCDDPYRRRS